QFAPRSQSLAPPLAIHYDPFGVKRTPSVLFTRSRENAYTIHSGCYAFTSLRFVGASEAIPCKHTKSMNYWNCTSARPAWSCARFRKGWWKQDLKRRLRRARPAGSSSNFEKHWLSREKPVQDPPTKKEGDSTPLADAMKYPPTCGVSSAYSRA